MAATSQGKGNVYKLKGRNVYKPKGRSVYKLKGRNVYKLKGRNVYKLKGRNVYKLKGRSVYRTKGCIAEKPDPWPLLCPLSRFTLAGKPLERALSSGSHWSRQVYLS